MAAVALRPLGVYLGLHGVLCNAGLAMAKADGCPMLRQGPLGRLNHLLSPGTGFEESLFRCGESQSPCRIHAYRPGWSSAGSFWAGGIDVAVGGEPKKSAREHCRVQRFTNGGGTSDDRLGRRRMEDAQRPWPE